jgi:hypothetical protein
MATAVAIKGPVRLGNQTLCPGVQVSADAATAQAWIDNGQAEPIQAAVQGEAAETATPDVVVATPKVAAATPVEAAPARKRKG